jgi:hypothetical protein
MTPEQRVSAAFAEAAGTPLNGRGFFEVLSEILIKAMREAEAELEAERDRQREYVVSSASAGCAVAQALMRDPGEGSMDDHRARAARLQGDFQACLAVLAERTRLRAALEELWTWVDNWSPPFVEDAEWPATREKVRAAIGKT